RFIRCSISHYDTGVTASLIYETNQLEAMQLADKAWKEVDAMTIRQCWKKSGILPDITPTDSRPAEGVEMELTVALDGLQQRGVLQASNRLSLEELLNPVAELHNEMLEEEIYHAVMEAQHGNLLTNDDAAEDDLVDPPPTCCEALQAALVIMKYVETMDEPFA
ncbi:hypothetical protein V8B97DRAFT_1875375, partial [Scleroderma yunnanense]